MGQGPHSPIPNPQIPIKKYQLFYNFLNLLKIIFQLNIFKKNNHI